MPELNFFDNYLLQAITEEIVPETSFFRDRYFPTEAGDIFAADKVLTEYQKGDRKMACFVAPRVGDIPVERKGYAIHEYQPAYIAPSRLLTIDDLSKRGFGEAIFPGSTPAERAARLQLRDLTDLDRRIRRLEEWMAVQTMINNGCTMQEYVDANTVRGGRPFSARPATTPPATASPMTATAGTPGVISATNATANMTYPKASHMFFVHVLTS